MRRWWIVGAATWGLAGCGSLPPGSPVARASYLGHVVTLNIDGLSGDAPYAMRQAVDGWNNGLGWKHFRIVSGVPSDISAFDADGLAFLQDGQPSDLMRLGLFSPGHTARIDVAGGLGPHKDVLRVCYHELGHAMGLGHSIATGSIMFFNPTAMTPEPEDVASASKTLFSSQF